MCLSYAAPKSSNPSKEPDEKAKLQEVAKHHENVAQANPVHHFLNWNFDKILHAEVQQSEQQSERPYI